MLVSFNSFHALSSPHLNFLSLHPHRELLHAIARKVLKEEKVDLSVLDDEVTA